MFFLARGKIEIVTEYGEVIETAEGPSSWFGEVGILSDLPRTASIKCKTDCSVYELKDSDMRSMMDKYPEVREGIEETSKERLQAHLMRSILA
jgi:CRP-like cAMP-binding protein